MKNIFLFLLFIAATGCSLKGQSWLAHIDPAQEALAKLQDNSPLIEIFNTYGVAQYKVAFPGAKTSYLQGSRYISLVDPSLIYSLKQELEATQIFDLIEVEEVMLTPESIEALAECNNPVPITDPNTANQTYFDLMEFPCAWSITSGCPDISIGLCDVSLNYNHPDMAGKIADIQCITCDPAWVDICDHGFSTAGALIALHNNQCVAGAGKNSTLKAYLWQNADCAGPPVNFCACHQPTILALWAAFNDGNRVILAETPRLGGIQVAAALQAMVDGGATIILPSLTYPDNPNGHSAVMGLDGVVVVGPLDGNLNYWQYNQLNVDMEIGVPARHSAANSEDMWQLDSPDDGDGQLCRANGGGGTSIGSPNVAAAVALMLCVNPCLTPAEIESILKNTANTANGAPNNSGALNAYQAVLAAQNAVPQSLVVAAGQTETISNQTVSYSSITIESQGTLVINNQSVVQMHKLGFITVKRGAKLIVDNSTLTTNCPKDYWGGIRVWGNNTLPQPVVYDANDNPLLQYPLSADQAGVVYLLNNSRYERGNAISTHALGVNYPTLVSLRGGVVFAKNTEFVDNRRVAEFTQYPPPNAGYTFKNTSKFIDCFFTEASGDVDGSIGVTIWDTDGITFNRCNFQDLDWEGITTYDAGAIIKDGNNFLNNWRAITNTATYPFGAWLEWATRAGH